MTYLGQRGPATFDREAAPSASKSTRSSGGMRCQNVVSLTPLPLFHNACGVCNRPSLRQPSACLPISWTPKSPSTPLNHCALPITKSLTAGPGSVVHTVAKYSTVALASTTIKPYAALVTNSFAEADSPPAKARTVVSSDVGNTTFPSPSLPMRPTMITPEKCTLSSHLTRPSPPEKCTLSSLFSPKKCTLSSLFGPQSVHLHHFSVKTVDYREMETVFPKLETPPYPPRGDCRNRFADCDIDIQK